MNAFLWILITLFQPMVVSAWGIKKELKNSQVIAASLSTKLYNSSKINFCVKIDSEARSRFQNSEIELEVRAALKLWSQAFAKSGFHRQNMNFKVDCASMDLLVQIGNRSVGDFSNGAYTQVKLADDLPKKLSAKPFILIKINSDNIWNETRSLPGNENGKYQFTAFSALNKYKRDMNLAALIDWVTFAKPTTVDQLAESLRVSHGTVFWTSYRVLVHEVGHAFGLCDTGKGLFEYQCDPQLSSHGDQQPSIMLNSNFFYLTEDDQQGLARLYQRIKDDEDSQNMKKTN